MYLGQVCIDVATLQWRVVSHSIRHTVFINYFQKCLLSKIFMKGKFLFIIGANKISGAQLEKIFLFVLIYSVYTDFYWKTTTNQVQVNIPNDSKTVMDKTIHSLQVCKMFIKLVTHYYTITDERS